MSTVVNYYVVTHQNKGTESKIRIEYVLKSAEVRTFVSSWYSEDSSHTHLCIPVHTRAHQWSWSFKHHIRI